MLAASTGTSESPSKAIGTTGTGVARGSVVTLNQLFRPPAKTPRLKSGVGLGEIMVKSVIHLLLACLCLGVSSCSRPPEPLNVQIPAGLVTATHAQSKFIANVQTLSRGMSLQDAKRHLGAPTQEKSDSLFYWLVESRIHGGYCVAATLKFDDRGLADVKVEFGHVTLSPRPKE